MNVKFSTRVETEVCICIPFFSVLPVLGHLFFIILLDFSVLAVILSGYYKNAALPLG